MGVTPNKFPRWQHGTKLKFFNKFAIMTSSKLAYYPADPPTLNLLDLPLFALSKEPQEQSQQDKPFDLRDYQTKVIREVYRFFKFGKKSCLVYAPTGAGKTVISAQIIADAVKKGRRVLFCCHRQKLIKQTQQTLLKSFQIESGIIWADRATDYDKPVQIAMIQTLQNRELPEDIGLVIFDECHSSIYFKICYDIMMKYSGGIFTLSPCYFIGLTATPWRTKQKEGFCQYFDCIVRAPDPLELVKMGYLARPRLFGYGGLIDFSQLETSSSSGDYTEASLQLVCNEEYNAKIVEHFLEICPERKTIAFCAGVAQAENLADQFNQVGIKSVVVIGETPESQRDAIYQQFAKGEIQLISSVGCLCEGFDEPSVEAAIIARPTRSKSLLIQMCGRALRLFEGKVDAFLLDFGECFKRCIDPRKKLPIGLCPSEKPLFSQLKECPECHAMVPKFSRICPECGFEFFEEAEEEEDGDDMPQFGELLTEEEEKHLRYLRQQMKTAYTKGRNPARISALFRERFGYLAPDEWFIGAIFGMKNVESNRQIYRNYLQLIRPEASQKWFDYMLKLEFGVPGKNYRTKNGKNYTAPSNDCTSYRPWWEILKVSAAATWEEVKTAYRSLAMDWHPDKCADEAAAEIMKLINHAFDCAKQQLRR